MGYEDVDVTLRLRAIDETDRVMADAARRAKSTTDAMVRGMSDIGKATLEASRTTQKLTEGLTAAGRATQQFATAASNVSAMTKAMGDYNISTDRMARGMAQAGQAAAQAAQAAKGFHTNTSLASSIVKEATGTLLKYAAGFTTVTGAIAAVNRGFTSFAEGQRGMDRIQLDTKATSDQMEHLGKTIGALKSITGESGTALRQNFSAFREQTGLAFDDAEKLFNRIALASHAAGTNFEDMSRSAVAAITNFKVPQEEVSAMLDTWVKTIPSSMMSTFAQAAPRITQLLHGIGYSGKESAEGVASAFANLAVKLGNARLATSVLEDIFTKATDINSALGMQTVPMIQRVLGKPDEFKNSWEAIYKVVKQSGIFDTQDLAQKSMIRQMLGLDDRTIEAIKAQHDEIEKIDKVAKRLGLTYGEVDGRIKVLNGGAQRTLDTIAAATDKIYTAIGKLFNLTQIPNRFGETLAKDASDMERLVYWTEKLIKLLPGGDKPTGGGAAETTIGTPGKIIDPILDTLGATGQSKLDLIAPYLQKMGIPVPTSEQRAQNQAKFTAERQKQEEEDKKKAARDAEIEAEIKKENDARAKIDAEDRAKKQGFPGRSGTTGPTGPTPQDLDRVKRGMGNFATGGEFTVPGSGRADDTPVSFMGTPGERVTVQSVPEIDRKESLQRQQDKADVALREHFARFHDKSRAGAQIGKGWPGDILGRGGAGGGGGGGGGGGDPAAGTRTGTGARGGDGTSTGDGKTGTPPVPGIDAPLNAPVGTDPQSATGPAEDIETAIKRGYLPPMSGGGGGGLAADRAKFAKELEANPALRDKILRIAHNEQGGNAQGTQAVIESMMNRASYSGRTLAQEARWAKIEGGYYDPGGQGKGMTAAQRAVIQQSLSNALSGSNVSNYGTDNASGSFARNRIANDMYRQTNLINGEYFSSPGLNPAGPGKGNYNKYQAWLTRMKTAPATTGIASAPGTMTTAGLKTALEGPDAPAVGGGKIVMSGSGKSHAGLDEKLTYAALQSGLEVRVAHGLEPNHARHTANAPAYDLDLYDPALKRNLKITNPEDRKRIAKFIEDSVAAGAGGVGAGGTKDNWYMGEERIHVGGGSDVAWGHKGKGANAAPWLKEAWARGMARRMKPEQLAIEIKKLRDQQAKVVADEKTKVAGPAAVSDVETRAAARYKAAQERQASGVTFPSIQRDTTLPSHDPGGLQDATPHVRAVAPAVSAASAARRTAAAKSIAAATPKAAPAADPAAKAIAKGKAVAGELAEGGTAGAGQDVLVGEDGPEVLSMGPRSGTVWTPEQLRTLSPEHYSGAAPDLGAGASGRTDPASIGPFFGSDLDAVLQLAPGGPAVSAGKSAGAALLGKLGGMAGKWAGGQVEHQLTREGLEAGHGVLGQHRQFEDRLDQLRRGSSGSQIQPIDQANADMRSSLGAPIEPVIRPRIQQTGPLSMRWTRQSERQRHTDISRDQARTAHTDQGFA